MKITSGPGGTRIVFHSRLPSLWRYIRTGKKDESKFLTWARKELERAGVFSKESDYDGMLGSAVMKMCETF
mgnify:CR=1 FL=1